MDVENGDDDMSDLSDLPFEVLRKLQEKVGLKKFQQYLKSKESTGSEPELGESRKRKSTVDAGNVPATHVKGKPLEISSKRKQRKPRQIIIGQARSRDPRFENQSGSFNEDLFEKSYSFLDDTRANEIKKIKKDMRKTKSTARREELGRLLQSMKDTESSKAAKKEAKQRKSQRIKDEVSLVKQGKKPFFLKQSDQRALDALESFEAMKKTGSLQKKLKIKRKRGATKMSKRMPAQFHAS
eukprot:m.1043113 g.1043113  ORF g.1043113 m.1043113 type:complete len:240 (-) comp24165_c1_seq3:1960-2679(-)